MENHGWQSLTLLNNGPDKQMEFFVGGGIFRFSSHTSQRGKAWRSSAKFKRKVEETRRPPLLCLGFCQGRDWSDSVNNFLSLPLQRLIVQDR